VIIETIFIFFKGIRFTTFMRDATDL